MPTNKIAKEKDYVAIVRHGDTASIYYFPRSTKRALMAQLVKQDLFGEAMTQITIDEAKQYEGGFTYITTARE